MAMVTRPPPRPVCLHSYLDDAVPYQRQEGSASRQAEEGADGGGKGRG